MKKPFLGKLLLRWCERCNLPVLEEGKCPICNSRTTPVRIALPGDVRVAFPYDISLIKKVLEKDFGKECVDPLFPKEKAILLNKTSYMDRMDEIIVDGKVIGNIRFDPTTLRYFFMPKMEGARRIAEYTERKVVEIFEDAVKFISEGKNVLVPGVKRASPDINEEDEVVVRCQRRAVAVGKAKMSYDSLKKARKGVAVKVRESGEVRDAKMGKEYTVDDIMAANESIMEKRIKEAVDFIRYQKKRWSGEILVAYSGGKDSLATMELVREAGVNFTAAFVDTGLEFPETVKNVEDIGEDTIVERAGDAFDEGIDIFGPPARDFRWCCKLCKLAPMGRVLERVGKALTFIGQRRYESLPRKSQGRVWENAWVPGQRGASPIFNWTSLHVWLYIFMRKLNYNILYERGKERIGCWVCPAQKLAEIESTKITHPHLWKRWEKKLMEWADVYGYDEKWVKYGLWRWKKVTPVVKELAKRVNATLRERERFADERLNYKVIIGKTGCKDDSFGFEAIINSKLNVEHIKNLSYILGDAKITGSKAVHIKNGEVSIIISETGSMSARGINCKEDAKNLFRYVISIVLKSIVCFKCMVCVKRCDNGAIFIKDGKPYIEEDKCEKCLKCLQICPLTVGGVEIEI